MDTEPLGSQPTSTPLSSDLQEASDRPPVSFVTWRLWSKAELDKHNPSRRDKVSVKNIKRWTESCVRTMLDSGAQRALLQGAAAGAQPDQHRRAQGGASS